MNPHPKGPKTNAPERDTTNQAAPHLSSRSAAAPASMATHRSRVGKSMQPGSPGTVRLTRRFGASLVLVRHRYDWTGLYRYTTVELIVDVAPISRGPCLSAHYAVRLKSNEAQLLTQARELGACWQPTLRCWTLPGEAVQTLGLIHRVESAARPHRLHRPRRRK